MNVKNSFWEGPVPFFFLIFIFFAGLLATNEFRSLTGVSFVQGLFAGAVILLMFHGESLPRPWKTPGPAAARLNAAVMAYGGGESAIVAEEIQSPVEITDPVPASAPERAAGREAGAAGKPGAEDAAGPEEESLEVVEDAVELTEESAGTAAAAGASGHRDAGEPEEIEELEEAKDESSSGDLAAYKMNPFVPKEFLRLLNRKSVMDLKLGDHHQQEMTIFFSDIRQFTELFESLSPEEGFRFINSYLTRIVPTIEQYGGFVDKYIGDAVMALFPQSNGADMAVRSAIEIQKKVLEYNTHRAKCGYRALEIGIGLHTGTLMLGVVGVYNRMQNTVISDSVNLASRIEGLTKAFGVSMAISGQTFQKLEHPESYMFRYLGNVKVKGRGEPTRVYEILNGISQEKMEKKMQTNMYFEQGLFSFMQKKYDDALASFDKVLEIIPGDKASLLYREHCMAKMEEAHPVQA